MGLIIEIKVIPGSKKQELCFDKTGKLKCHLKNQPIQGQANQELIKLLSKTLKIPSGDITLVSGQTGRNKRIKLNTLKSLQEILIILGFEKQMSLFCSEDFCKKG